MSLAPPTTARDRVVVRGADAVTFLDGQLSQDVAGQPVGEPAWSFLLEPQGRVVAWLRLTRRADGSVELDVDPGWGEAVVERLRRFLLRVDVQLDLVAAPAAEATPDQEAARLEQGVPRHGTEITADRLPAELGQHLVDASVSFTKGCFTGQELVARIDSRGGRVPQVLRGLLVEGAEPPAGAELLVAGAVVGTVTSAATSPALGAVALAFVRREVDPPAGGSVRWSDGEAAVRILPLPLVPPAG